MIAQKSACAKQYIIELHVSMSARESVNQSHNIYNLQWKPNEYEDYSDSDESDNGRIDDNEWLQALSNQQQNVTQDGAHWTYLAHSQRGSLVYGSNRTKILPTSKFKLQFNAADAIKLEKARIEIRHLFDALKRKLNLNQDRPLLPTESLVAVTPRDWTLSQLLSAQQLS